MDEEKKVISYSSEESQKKRVGKGLLLEGVVILGIGIIIFAGLVYFKVIDLNKISINNKSAPITVNGSEYDVVATSNVPGYSLTIKDKEGLIKLLNEWGVYDKTYNGGYGLQGATGKDPVKKITVVFTTDEQPVNQFVTQDGTVYMSSITKAAAGELNVNLHVGPSVLNNPKNKEPWRQVDYIFLTTVYNISHPISNETQYQATNEDLQNYLMEKSKGKEQFFSLEKN